MQNKKIYKKRKGYIYNFSIYITLLSDKKSSFPAAKGETTRGAHTMATTRRALFGATAVTRLVGSSRRSPLDAERAGSWIIAPLQRHATRGAQATSDGEGAGAMGALAGARSGRAARIVGDRRDLTREKRMEMENRKEEESSVKLENHPLKKKMENRITCRGFGYRGSGCGN